MTCSQGPSADRAGAVAGPVRPLPLPRGMDTEAFQHYLSDTSRRAAPLADGFDGAAGGAPCGDLVRLSLEVRDGSIARVSFDAEG